jgi:hypothetical protein
VAKSHFRFSVYQGLMVLVLIGTVKLLEGWSQQQTPTAPLPPAGLRTPPQTIDPPIPADGEGVELTVRVVDALNGKGLPDVKLEMTRIVASQPPVGRGAPPSAPPDRRLWQYSKSTDALGAVTISNMAADSYRIIPALAGHVLAKGAVDSLTLTKGKKPVPITFRMWKAASIEGTVHDVAGNPVANATVEVLEEIWPGGWRTLAPAALPVAAPLTSTPGNVIARARPNVTDQDGKFSFPNIVPGTYYLRAIPVPGIVQEQLKASAGAQQAAFVDTLYPGVTMLEQAAPLKVDAGGTLFGLRIEMQKTRYYSFSGKVTGIPPEVRSSGLVLIRRSAFDSPFPFVWGSPYAGATRVQINPDGTFNAPSVPPGPYWAGYTPAGPVRGGAQFRIDDRNIEAFPIEVTPGISFAGKAVYDDGTPASGGAGTVSVFLPTMGVYVREFFIQPNGEFNTSGLPAGPYRLVGPASAVIRKIEIDKRPFSGGEFELTPLGGIATVTLGRTGGVIQGSVDLHDQAKAYARGMVTIHPLPLQPMDTPIRRYLDGKTTFSAEHLEAGRYRVCAWLEEGSDVDRVLGNPRYEQKFGLECQSVNLSADENRSVQLKQVSAQDFR